MPLADVIGHRRVVALLARSARRGSLPPSLIFAGPAGVGKRQTAVATAQLLNCAHPVANARTAAGDLLETDACGACPACTRIARGVHADVLIVEPGDSGSIKIESVRDIIDRAGYRPFEGRRRVVIIDDADALMPAAQNALLKTLEEPPSSSSFVLVTAQPDMLLPTVASRCPRLRFGHVDNGPGEVAVNRELAAQALVRAAASGDPRRRLEAAKDLLPKTSAGGAGEREQLAGHLRSMATLVRDAELVATGADVRDLANPGLSPALERLAESYKGERGVRAFAAIDRALAALDRNAGVKIVADWVMLQL